MKRFPEDSQRFLQVIRERQLRERIAAAKVNTSMPSTAQLLTETHGQRAYRRAIATIARVEKMLDEMK
jgi:hypothetical protein